MPDTVPPAELPIVLTPLSGEDAPKTVLVKFYFTNENCVPKGIRLKQPKLSKAAQEIVRKESGIEQGEEVLKNLPDTSVSNLRQELAEYGFALVDVHYTRQERAGMKPKFTLTASFERDSGRPPTSFLPETETALDDLTATTWEHAHMWWHENGVDVINLIGRRPERKPRHMIAVRDDALQAVAVAIAV